MVKIYLFVAAVFSMLMISAWYLLVQTGLLFPSQISTKKQKPVMASIIPPNEPESSQSKISPYWEPKEKPTTEVLTLSVADYKGLHGTGEMRIIEPNTKAPDKAIFVFPGYTPAHDPFQQRPSHVVEKMNLRKQANALNALIIIPKMNTTVYETHYYPQTSQKWDPAGNIPGGIWCNQILLDYVVFTYFKGNTPPLYAIGISTGAQGAMKFGLHQSQYIKGIIGLSGTYDLLAPDGEPELHVPVFGEKTAHFSIWNQESISNHINQINFPLAIYSESNSYLADQTRRFITLLRSQKKSLTADSGNTLVPGSSHNWGFWANKTVLETITNHIENWK